MAEAAAGKIGVLRRLVPITNLVNIFFVKITLAFQELEIQDVVSGC